MSTQNKEEMVMMPKQAAENLRAGVDQLRAALEQQTKEKEAAVAQLRNKQAAADKAAEAAVDSLVEAGILSQTHGMIFREKFANAASGHVESLIALQKLAADYGATRTVPPPVIGTPDNDPQAKSASHNPWAIDANTVAIGKPERRSAADEVFESMF